jgi:hypothetical protein
MGNFMAFGFRVGTGGALNRLNIAQSIDGKYFAVMGAEIYGGEDSASPSIRDPDFFWETARQTMWMAYSLGPNYGATDSPGWWIARSKNLKDWETLPLISLPGTQVWAPQFFIDSDGTRHVIINAKSDGVATPPAWMASSGAKMQAYEMHPVVADDLSGAWSDPVALGLTGENWTADMFDWFILRVGNTFHAVYATDTGLLYATSSALMTGWTTDGVVLVESGEGGSVCQMDYTWAENDYDKVAGVYRLYVDMGTTEVYLDTSDFANWTEAVQVHFDNAKDYLKHMTVRNLVWPPLTKVEQGLMVYTGELTINADLPYAPVYGGVGTMRRNPAPTPGEM